MPAPPISTGNLPRINRPPLRKGSYRLAAILIAAIVVGSMLATTSLAAGGSSGDGGSGSGGGSGGDGSGQGPVIPGDRKVDVDAGPRYVSVNSTLKSGSGGDTLGFRFVVQNQLRIELQYSNDGAGSQATIRLAIAFHRIIEFEDEDGDGTLSPTDEVVSTYNLEGADYADIQYQTRTTLDGKEEQAITVRTRDRVFGVVTHLSGTDASIGSGKLSPSWAKMDLMIKDYPYQRTTTRLALQTRLETQAQIAVLYNASGRAYLGSDEGGVEARTGDVLAYYSWLKHAAMDGQEAPVGATSSADGGVPSLYLCYGHADNITHDPKLGLPLGTETVDDGFDPMSRLVPFAVALVVGAVLAAIAVSWRRRRNGVS